MIIKTVTVTGVDIDTDCERMAELSVEYPFVEWGILYSESRAGQEPKYMDLDDIEDVIFDLEDFETTHKTFFNTALHVCGRITRDPEKLFHRLSVSDFNRVQFNVNMQEQPTWFQTVYPYLKKHFVDTPIITQHNENNKHLWEEFAQTSLMHHILFDGSGGRGEVAQHYSKPIPGIFCGYAGGITPENVFDILTEIELKAIDDLSQPVTSGVCWIDMESGVRTNDTFDLDKVESVLKVVKQFTW